MSRKDLEYIFNPKSVAIIGVSNKSALKRLGGGGGLYLQYLLNAGYRGNIYPVNPKGGEISNLKIYPNVTEIPEAVDYVICCIPAKEVIPLIEECIANHVKVVHIYSSGFSEYGTEKGKTLEKKIASLARQSGMRIIGPNCIGVYCPKTGLSFNTDGPADSGTVGLASQSGGLSNIMVREATIRGVRFSKAISYGNACDVNESDLIEYLADDPDTEVITVYIEGVKDGKRFCDVLREATKKKPVIMLKGGVGEAGARATVSHTASLAGADQAWDALFRQFGIVRVYSLEELIDMAIIFTRPPKLSGRNVGLLCTGGGPSVVATDTCSRAGLNVPRFPVEMSEALASYSVREGVGLCVGNPVDLSGEFWKISYHCAKIMLDYPGIDILISQLTLNNQPDFFEGIYEAFVNSVEELVRAIKDSEKLSVLAVPVPISDETFHVVSEFRRICREAGIPVYNSLANAAKAVAMLAQYQENQE